MQGTSKISVEHAKYVISKGDIIVGSQQMNGGTKALFSVEQDKNGTSLYVGNLDVNGGPLILIVKLMWQMIWNYMEVEVKQPLKMNIMVMAIDSL